MMDLDDLYDENAGRSSKMSVPSQKVVKAPKLGDNLNVESSDDYWGDLDTNTNQKVSIPATKITTKT